MNREGKVSETKNIFKMWIQVLIFITLLTHTCRCENGSICGGLFKFGCFRKAGGEKLSLTKLVYNGRATIDWRNYELSIANILCKCKAMAEKDGYKVFGVQYYGECWASKQRIIAILDSLKESNECYNGKYKACDKNKNNELCAGSDTSTSIFTTGAIIADSTKIDGGYGQWSEWSSCSATCGYGYQERTRKCDSPKPANGGKICSDYLGESEDMRKCMVKECQQSKHKLLPLHCEKMEDDEEFNSLFSAPLFNPKAPFCLVPAISQARDVKHYSISVDLYSVTGQNTRMGIFFNSQDENNYDFAYIHVRGEFYCFSTGQVVNSTSDWRHTISQTCNQVFRSKRWTPLKLTVDDSKARFYGNNELLVEWKIVSRDTGKGGLLLKNGLMKSDQSKVHFKDLIVE